MSIINFGGTITASTSGSLGDFDGFTLVYVHSKATDKQVTICTSKTDNTAVRTFQIGLDQSLVVEKTSTQGIFGESADIFFTPVNSVRG